MKKLFVLMILSLLALSTVSAAEENNHFSAFLKNSVTFLNKIEIQKEAGEIDVEEYEFLAGGIATDISLKFVACEMKNAPIIGTAICTAQLEAAQKDLIQAVRKQEVDTVSGYSVLGMTTERLDKIKHGVER